VLLIDKPAGPSSHDVVALVRRKLGQKRVGHAGTLDPPATGLLVVLVGRATRLARFVTMLPKSYRGSVRFGFETTTDDATGEPSGAPDDAWRGLTGSDVEAALQRLASRHEQQPPAFSAKKVEGRRAYRLARAGKNPALRAVPVNIHALRCAGFEPSRDTVTIELTCSAGTYVRAVARDLGRELGTRAHLDALRRTAVGSWTVDQAVPLESLEQGAALLPMREAVAHLPSINVDEESGRRFRDGRPLAFEPTIPGFVAVYRGELLLGVAAGAGGSYRPVVGLAS
jgi:tRNA pseudouridine55 synthase